MCCMKFICRALAGAVLFTVALAGNAAGENLVVNGRFEADQTLLPLYWLHPERAKVGETVFFEQDRGPKGIPCVRYVNAGPKEESFGFRQIGYTLVEGARYRLSAQIRTKGFKGKGSVYVLTQGWTAEAGISGVPENSPWTLYTKEIVAPKTAFPKNYGVILHAHRFTGEIAFADVTLEPLDEAAKKGSRQPSAALCEKLTRFFPWAPRLSQIDRTDRQVTFRFAGELPQGDTVSDYTVTLKTDEGEVSAPLRPELNTFRLPGSAAEGRLSFALRKGDAPPLLTGSFPYRTIDRASIDVRGHRRLNNLVTEVLSVRASPAGEHGFCTTRAGWIFLRADDAKAEVRLDGETVVASGEERREAVREVRPGAHTVAVAGATDGRLTVRQIPDILNYPSCADSPVGTNPSYGWEFFRKYVMPNSTTHCGGNIPPERYAEFKRHGGTFLDNIVTRGLVATNFADRILGSRAFARQNSDGVALDEHLFGEAETFGDFVGGMRDFTARYDGGRRIDSWIVGKPLLFGLDRETYALAVNATPDGCHVLSEVYCRSRPTEEEARQHISDYLVDTGRKFREIRPGVPFYPDALSGAGMVLGNFSQIPTISTWHHTQIDYKVFLDLQFQALATDPAFDGLGLVGVWGSYYCDEEIYRWTFMLARHYCIEGRTELLSKKYGLSYLPGHLLNGDFEDGFANWRTNGTVRIERIRGLGENVERRWGGSTVGDAFALLAKADGKPARIGQVIRGLVPGRMYTMDVTCFDVKDVRTKTWRPAELPLAVTMDATAEKDPSLSWTFVDRRPKGTHGWGVKVNRHHVVFTARASEIRMMLDNSAAEDGTEIGVNAIGVWPYIAR